MKSEKEIAVEAKQHAEAAFALAETLMPECSRFDQAAANWFLILASQYRLVGMPGVAWVVKETK
jgi:hypothetical protein